MSNKPNPGSKEAQVLGCVCPVLDNSYGKGYLGDGEKFGFVMNENCPLHAPTTEEKTNIFLEQFKSAMKRFKHNQEDVGNILGISRSSVSRILQGKQSNLATKLMKEIRLYTRYGKIPQEELITQKYLDRLEEAMNKPVYTKDAVEFTTVEYIKQDWKGQIRNIGCMTATLVQLTNDSDSPYVVAIGVSFCNSQHDKFDKKIARDIALGRAKNHHKEYKLKNKYLYDDFYKAVYLNDVIDEFILRCMRYYRDKSIIHPKIIFV
jgi:transcriptional regulator with XRE-family HTH domain